MKIVKTLYDDPRGDLKICASINAELVIEIPGVDPVYVFAAELLEAVRDEAEVAALTLVRPSTPPRRLRSHRSFDEPQR